MVYISTKFHENILNGIKVIQLTPFSSENFQRAIIPSKLKVECRSLFFVYRLMMVYFCTKFHESILNSIRVIELTRKVNRRTDGRPDRQTAKKMVGLTEGRI